MWKKIKVDIADEAFSRFIRLRDKKCLRCYSSVKFSNKGLPVSHQASHFQSRGKENTRFDSDNVCTLCPGCHMYFTSNPAEHYQFQVERLGQYKVDEIILKSHLYCKKDRLSEALYWRKEVAELLAG